MKFTHPTPIRAFLCAALLLAVLAGCSITPPVPTDAVVPPATAVVTEAPPPTATETAAPTLPPTATESRCASGAPYNFENISLCVPQVLGSELLIERLPASPASADTPFPGDVYPSYVQYSFHAYPTAGAFHQPRVLFYPADEYAAMSEYAAEIIRNLRALLDAKPAAPADALPFLPMWNAAQVFHSRTAYLEFQGGSGVRYLTEYAQSFSTVNNSSLFYTFQGLTDDGKYYISAILPVGHPSLPLDDTTIPGGDFNAFAENFQTYLSETLTALEAQPDGSFSPSLVELDALIQSLQIQ